MIRTAICEAYWHKGDGAAGRNVALMMLNREPKHSSHKLSRNITAPSKIQGRIYADGR